MLNHLCVSGMVFSETLRLHPLATPTPYAMQSLSISPPLLSTFFSTEGIRDLSELSLSQALLLPSVVTLFLHLLPNTPFGGLPPQHEVSLFHSSSLSNIFLICSWSFSIFPPTPISEDACFLNIPLSVCFEYFQHFLMVLMSQTTCLHWLLSTIFTYI